MAQAAGGASSVMAKAHRVSVLNHDMHFEISLNPTAPTIQRRAMPFGVLPGQLSNLAHSSRQHLISVR